MSTVAAGRVAPSPAASPVPPERPADLSVRVRLVAPVSARVVVPVVRRMVLPVVHRVVVPIGVLVALLVATLILPSVADAASPTPTRPSGTDTRSPLEGPGFVGAPVAALAAVLAIAVLALIVTTIYVRVTSGPGAPPPRE